MAAKSDKRMRLLNAARELTHKQGFFSTTLADIAQRADVPLGNVYYYFKTKEAIGAAIVHEYALKIDETLKSFQKYATPKERLLAYFHSQKEEVEEIAAYGSPVGTLCQELGKNKTELSEKSAHLLKVTLDWVAIQFSEMGLGEKSKELALHLESALQGATQLTHAFKEPIFLFQEIKNLENWVEQLAQQEVGLVETGKVKREEISFI